MNLPASSQLSALFSQSNLTDKEVWHLVVPASISVQAINRVDLSAMDDGSAVLRHQGADYGFHTEVRETQVRAHLLLPNEETGRFNTTTKVLSKVLCLQRLVELPDLSRISNEVESLQAVRRLTRKPNLEQPSGLRMRYKPLGDDDDTQESSEDSLLPIARQPAPEFRVPPSLKATKVKKRRLVADAADSLESPHKKSKKSRGANDISSKLHENTTALPASHDIQDSTGSQLLEAPTLSKHRGNIQDLEAEPENEIMSDRIPPSGVPPNALESTSRKGKKSERKESTNLTNGHVAIESPLKDISTNRQAEERLPGRTESQRDGVDAAIDRDPIRKKKKPRDPLETVEERAARRAAKKLRKEKKPPKI